MIVLPLLCALVVSISAAVSEPRWTTSYNDKLDIVLNRVQQYGPLIGLDPMKLPDVNRTLTVNVLLGQVSGGIVNTNGILTGATTLRRKGDATARFESNAIYIDADIDFVDLDYSYTSRAQFMTIGAGGKTSGEIDDLVLHITLRVDLTTPYYGQEELTDLTIKSTGRLTVHFDNGMSVLDQFADAISDAFTAAFKNIIINSVQPEIKKAMEYAIKKIDGSAV